MNVNTERAHLEKLADDTDAPKALRDQIAKHLTMYDRAVALHHDARLALAETAEHHKDYGRHESRRLVDTLTGKHPIALDDVALDMPAITHAVELAEDRVEITRRTVRAAWPTVIERPFALAIDDILPWMTAVRLSTPWTATMPAHLDYAWKQARHLYSWHLPMVAPSHRFPRLSIDRPTIAMQRTWQAIHDGDVQLLNAGPPRHYRVTVFWPDLNDHVE